MCICFTCFQDADVPLFICFSVLKQKSKHHPNLSNLPDLAGLQHSNPPSHNSTSMDISAAVSAAQWLVGVLGTNDKKKL